MRMRNLEISRNGMLKIDTIELPSSCVIILSDGVAKLTELPAHAEIRIITHQGKVKRVRWDEGEEF
ncbi:XtrA/YqaO family protein [Lysinibacillus sp. C5.1]|uniref:XtrA/YqaO family protein n=1 Tax=Lysinibacillus sp. C5.1 TaxID=2796169 RepID=UPI0030818DC5